MSRKIKAILWWMLITAIVLLDLANVYISVFATIIAIPVGIIYFIVRNKHPRFAKWLRILLWVLFVLPALSLPLILMMHLEA